MIDTRGIERIHGTYKVPVTSGYGTGIGGATVASCRSNFIIALDDDSEMPTDEELALIVEFREATVRGLYTERWAEKILAMDFPAVQGHNTLLLIKRPPLVAGGECEWGYRRMTWDTGPTFVPIRGAGNASLEHVLGLASESWKRARAT